MAKRQTVQRSHKAAVITVHGTGDSADTSAGDKWWQVGSPFAKQLQAKLSSQGIEGELVPFVWTGANSAIAREAASIALTKHIEEQSELHASVHIVGHSHGANVANEAASRLGIWDVMRARAMSNFNRYNPVTYLLPRSRARIASLTTVGAPFFQFKLTNADTFNPSWATALAGPGLIGTVVLLGLLITLQVMPPNIPPLWIWTLSAVCAVVAVANAIGCWFIVRFGFEELVRRTTLQTRDMYRQYRTAVSVRVHAIWHANDEAIAFLQKVETLPLEPLNKGMLYSRSRRSAIVAGVRFAIWSAVVLAVVALGGIWAYAFFSAPEALQTNGVEIALTFSFVGAMGAAGLAPTLFGLAYLINRFLFGTLPESQRGVLNRFIRGTFTGMAYGRDGAETLGSVAPLSHTFDTEAVVLSGDVAARMQTNAAAAASALIEKYRWALFTVGADTNSSLMSMATDAMTWDSLIHTTYFDQPEVADLIAAHIAAKHASASA